MSTAANKAVFLSYASQDAEPVSRIAEALRAAGVEVWFDQNELVGGDAWDAKIRGQIASCALFVPVISANTQARREGYFRLEWKLAAQRTHAMADGTPFLLPVVIDTTRDTEALVPAEFRAVQWSRLTLDGERPGAVAVPVFCARVRVLLGGDVSVAPTSPVVEPGTSVPRPIRRMRPLVAVGLGLALVFTIALWRPWEKSPPSRALPSLAPELANLRARIVPDRWAQADYEVMRPALDRWIQSHPEDAEAMALRSYISSLQVLRTLDFGTKVLRDGKADAERSLLLAPGSPLGELALGFHHVAMMTRGGEAEAARPHLERALAALPPDILTRYAQMGYFAFSLQLERVRQTADAWLRDDPAATFPRWCAAYAALVERKADDAEKWAERGLAGGEIGTTVRSLSTLFETSFFLRADLRAAREILERAPAAVRSHHRLVYARWFLALAERRWDEAIQELARVPDTVLQDRCFRGPKSLLGGIAHLKAGRASPAAAQFREAERILRELLGNDADDEELRLALALTLAYQGRADDARSELAAVEALLRGRPPYLYSGHAREMIAETHAVLGDVAGALPWLRLLLTEPSAVPYTPASFRLDVRFDRFVEDPRVQALLAGTGMVGSSPAESRPAEKSVAVLAFKNLSGDPAREFFSDGLSEAVAEVLGRVPGLKVVGSASAFSFKGKAVPIPEIARQLGVTHLVEGTVLQEGQLVRITAKLTQADGFQVWVSDKLEREAKNIFALHDEVSGLIAKNLSLKLGAGSAASTAAVNPQAFELYLQGRQAWNRRTLEDYQRAEVLFSRAIDLDPKFARAYVGRADARTFLTVRRGQAGTWGQRNAPQLAQLAEDLQQALKLDPDLAEAHASLGNLHIYRDKREEGQRSLERAIELNANYATAHQWLGLHFWRQGKLREARASVLRAVEADPLSSVISAACAVVLQEFGDTAAALLHAERAVALQPDSWRAVAAKSAALWAVGRKEEAVTVARSVEESNPSSQGLGRALLVLGRAGLTAEIEAKRNVSGGLANLVRLQGAVAMGRWDEFFSNWGPNMLTVDDPWFLYAPELDAVRGDARFLAVLKEAGLTEAHARAQAWRAAHPPDKPTTKQ